MRSIPYNAYFFVLVPKLQLGNPDREAPASRDRKLELPALNSQAGAWELAHSSAQSLISVQIIHDAISQQYAVRAS